MMIIVDGDEGEPNQRPGLTACRHAGFVDEGWGGREDMYIILFVIIITTPLQETEGRFSLCDAILGLAEGEPNQRPVLTAC